MLVVALPAAPGTNGLVVGSSAVVFEGGPPDTPVGVDVELVLVLVAGQSPSPGTQSASTADGHFPPDSSASLSTTTSRICLSSHATVQLLQAYSQSTASVVAVVAVVAVGVAAAVVVVDLQLIRR